LNNTSPSIIALVGHPNVGKSVLFHRLTGAYVNVSNYPGTTVEVTRASSRFDSAFTLLDTPGVLALPSRSDEEIDPLQREQLTAYGLTESRPLKVLQQRPMTVILADEVELALEHGVARYIWVARKDNENGS
jgi:ribosome biogenesis GTPase A